MSIYTPFFAQDGMTALMIAMKRKQIAVEVKIKVLNQLMEDGADINLQAVSFVLW